MSHLSFEEVVEYVSLSKLNEESIALASKVDTHIRNCDECLKLVRSVRLIHEEFSRLKKDGSIADFLTKPASFDEETRKRLAEIKMAFDGPYM